MATGNRNLPHIMAKCFHQRKREMFDEQYESSVGTLARDSRTQQQIK